jgi:hypothetical protein
MVSFDIRSIEVVADRNNIRPSGYLSHPDARLGRHTGFDSPVALGHMIMVARNGGAGLQRNLQISKPKFGLLMGMPTPSGHLSFASLLSIPIHRLRG